MIGVAKTAEDDVRNEFGFPRASITGGEHSPLTSNIDQSVNKALPWVAFSWFLSGGAIIGLVLMSLLMPEIIDSRVAAGVATQNAQINLTAQQADLARDTAYRMKAQLEQKGLIPAEGH